MKVLPSGAVCVFGLGRDSDFFHIGGHSGSLPDEGQYTHHFSKRLQRATSHGVSEASVTGLSLRI